MFWTVLGGSLASGGAGAVNHWYDRDIDAQMARTATRPVPAGRISPRAALTFGIVLAALSFVQLSLTVNVLSRGARAQRLPRLRVRLHDLAQAHDAAEHRHRRRGRRRAAARRLGGGHRAASRSTALYLFAIVFYWTPPHFWALSLLMKDEYARVGVPMMPVVRGEAETRQLIVLYTVLLVALTLMPVLFGCFGLIYGAAAALLGGVFISLTLRLWREAQRSQRAARVPVLPGLPRAAVLRDGGGRPAVDCAAHGPPARPQEPPDRLHRLRDHAVHVRHDLGGGAGLHPVSTEPEDTTLAPPAGEQIHLPEPSLLPLLNAVGISIAIIGIPISLILVIPGLVLFLVTAAVWIAKTRREMDELPLDHSAGH